MGVDRSARTHRVLEAGEYIISIHIRGGCGRLHPQVVTGRSRLILFVLVRGRDWGENGRRQRLVGEAVVVGRRLRCRAVLAGEVDHGEGGRVARHPIAPLEQREQDPAARLEVDSHGGFVPVLLEDRLGPMARHGVEAAALPRLRDLLVSGAGLFCIFGFHILWLPKHDAELTPMRWRG